MENIALILMFYVLIGAVLSILGSIEWAKQGYRFGLKQWYMGLYFWLPLLIINTVKELKK